jgi:hypothetical protein
MRPLTGGPSHGGRRDLGRVKIEVLLVVVVIGSVSCDYLRDKPAVPPPTNIRCEQVGPPLPDIPEDRKKRLDEIADLNSYIDLEVARHDKSAIDSVKMVIDGAHETMEKNKGPSKGRDVKNYLDAVNALDEAIDTAAKHRRR